MNGRLAALGELGRTALEAVLLRRLFSESQVLLSVSELPKSSRGLIGDSLLLVVLQLAEGSFLLFLVGFNALGFQRIRMR